MSAKKAIAMLLVLTMAVSLVLTGCGSSSSKPKVEGPQNVIVNLGDEPPQMNTITTTDTLSFNIIRHVYEGLIKLDKDNKPVAGIAEKWDISKDGLTYTFNLRKDAKWSNGTPVTSKDFAFAIKQLLNKDLAAGYGAMGFLVKNGEKFYNGEVKEDQLGVQTPDDNTLIITLERPTSYFLDLMGFGVFMPVNEAFYKTQSDASDPAKNVYGTEADKMIYNGPYIIESWDHSNQIVLKKNPNYYDPKATYLDQITWLMVKDSNAAYNMFAGDELDMVGLPGSELLNKAKNDGYEPLQYSDGGSFYVQYSFKDKITSNLNIRKALTFAIDRESFVKNVLKNSSLPAFGLTNPDVKGEKENFSKEVGDLFKDKQFDEAKKALDAGLKELGIAKASDLKIEFLCDDSDTAKKYAAAIQEFWKKNLGISAEVVSVPMKTRVQRMDEGQFQTVFAGWGPDYNDPMTYLDLFETGNGNNYGKYNNADYDKMLDDARNEADLSKRFEILKNLEKKAVVDDAVIGPIYYRIRDYAVKPKLKGVLRNTFQDINLLEAYIDNSAE